MKVLVALLGRSGWALFNSVWATISRQDYVPEKVYILTDGCQMKLAEQVRTMLSILLAEYEERHQIEIIPLDPEMVHDIADKVREIAEREKKLGNITALDVTSGTKPLVMGAVLPSVRSDLFDHVFCLHVDDLKNADRPYITIPLMVQQDHDLLREVR